MTQVRRPSGGRRRPWVAAASVLGHALVVLVLVSMQPETPKLADPEPVSVALVEMWRPPDPPPQIPKPVPEPDKPALAKAAPRPRVTARVTPPAPQVAPVPAGQGPSAQGTAEVSDAQLAGAGTADTGSGSGAGCNMTRRLQSALRKDRLVQAAVAEAHRGRAIMVWNGDWVRHGAQEGAGLAAVREAIIWEVGFAPEACRTEPLRGLIQISLSDRPGAPRLVVGSDAWRWSDVLFARGSSRR